VLNHVSNSAKKKVPSTTASEMRCSLPIHVRYQMHLDTSPLVACTSCILDQKRMFDALQRPKSAIQR